MNQEVTVSTSLPFYLVKEVANVMNRNRELLLLLSDNKICIDDQKRYLDELDRSFQETRSLSPYAKQYESILLDIVYRKRKTLILNDEYSEIKLCQRSNDKIYLVPEKSKKEIEELANNHPDVVPCNAEHIFDKLWSLPFKIKLEEGGIYDLAGILKPFARNSKSLAIIDPYIHNPRALTQFKKLVAASDIKNITIKCGDPAKMKKRSGDQKETSVFYEAIRELKNQGINVSFIYYDFYQYDSIGHKERYILFDDVQVYIPGGLDIFDKNGRFTNSSEGFYLYFDKREIKLKGKPKPPPF